MNDGWHPADTSARYGSVIEALQQQRVTRRQALKISAALGGTMPGLSFARALSAAMQFQKAPHPAFRIGDLPLWEVDPRRFDGRPRIHVVETEKRIEVGLSDALWPGTRLRCDLSFVATRGVTGWDARIDLPHLGFSSSVALEQWLLGREPAVSRMRLPQTERGEMLSGRFSAQMSPGWVFELVADAPSQCIVAGKRIAFDRAQVELVTQDQTTLPAPITQRAARIWFSLAEGSTLAFTRDGMRVDYEGRAHKVVAHLSRDAETLHVAQGEGAVHLTLRDDPAATPEPGIKLAAAGVTSEVVLAGGSPREWFAGNVAGASRWQDLGLLSVQLAAAPGADAFASAGGTARGEQRPRTLATCFVVPIGSFDRAMFTLRAGAADAEGCTDFGYCHPLRAPCAFSRRLDNYELTLQRAADLLCLKVRFFNVTLACSGTRWLLRRERADWPAILEFELPPQHVHEEAKYVAEALPGLAQRLMQVCQVTACLPTDPLDPQFVAQLFETAPKNPYNRESIAKGLSFDAYVEAIRKLVRIPAEEKKIRPLFVELMKIMALGEQAGAVLAGPTRLVFELHAREARHAVLPFAAPYLLSWGADSALVDERVKRGFGWLVQRNTVRAVPESGTTAGEYVAYAHDERAVLQRPVSLGAVAPAAATADAALPDLTAVVTAIEVPFRLSVTPVGRALRWTTRGAETPVVRGGASHELWSARVTDVSVRAIWSEDYTGDFYRPRSPYPIDQSVDTFRANLDANDRHQLVALTSVWEHDALCGTQNVIGPDGFCAEKANGKYVPTPFRAEHLALTSQGATVAFRGSWDPPRSPTLKGALTITRYKQDIQTGRNKETIVEYKGYLWPLGLPATLIKETRRKIQRGTDDKTDTRPRARELQRFFIRVGPDAFRSFPVTGQQNDGRDWPLTMIRMDPMETPSLCAPENSDFVDICDAKISGTRFGRQVFWPKYPLRDGSSEYAEFVVFEFMEVVGREVRRYRAPLLFVDYDVANDRARINDVHDAYARLTDRGLGLTQGDWPTERYPGFVHPVSAKLRLLPGESNPDTDFETDAFVIGSAMRAGWRRADAKVARSTGAQLDRPAGAPRDEISFTPRMLRAKVSSRQLATLSGNPLLRYLVQYDPVYRASGFDGRVNAGEIFGVFAGEAPRLTFSQSTSSAGGFASPDTTIVWLSRRTGPTGGPKEHIAAVSAASVERLPRVAAAAGTAPRESSAHAGDFDPLEYFKETLGEAKVLGCVRLVDILEVAVHASGTRVPTINQSELFDFPREFLDELLQDAQGVVRDVEQKLADQAKTANPSLQAIISTRITPRLEQVRSALRELQAVVNKTPPNVAAIIAAAGRVADAVRALVNEISKIVSDPQSLLPPDVQAAARQIQAAVEALRNVMTSGGRELVAELRDTVAAALRDVVREEIDRVERELRSRLDVARQQAEDRVRKQLDDVEAQVRSVTDRFAIPLRTVIERLIAERITDPQQIAQLLKETAEAYLESLAWLEVAGPVRELCAKTARAWLAPLVELVNAVDAHRGWLGQDYFRAALAARVENASKAVQDLQMTLDVYSRDIAAELAGNPAAAPVADRLVHAIAELKRLIAQANTQAALLFKRLDDLAAVDKRWLDAQLENLGECRFDLTVSDDARETLRLVRQHLDHYVTSWAETGTVFRDVARSVDAVLVELANAAKIATFSAVEQARKQIEQQVQAALGPVVVVVQDALGLAAKPPTAALLARIVPAVCAADTVLGPDTCRHINSIVSEATELVAALEKIYRNPGAVLANLRDQALQQMLRARALEQVRDLMTAGLALEQAAREQIAGARKAISARIDAELNTLLAPVKKGAKTAADTLGALSKIALLDERVRADAAELASALLAIAAATDARTHLLAATALIERAQTAGRRLAEIIGSGRLDELVEVEQIARELLDRLGIPTAIQISYNWDTPLSAFPKGDGAIFEPLTEKGVEPRLSIDSLVKVDVRNATQPAVSVNARLPPFTIHLFGKRTSNFLSVTFDEITFRLSGSDHRFVAPLRGVKVGAALEFVQKLQALLAPTSGFYAIPSPKGIEAGYRFGKDLTQLGGLTIQNISFGIGVLLPFDNTPARVTFRLSDPQKPFLVSAGIYGGGGFVGITSRADKLEVLEASFEYGAVTAFSFGVASGTGRITAGIYIRIAGGGPVVAGFFNASGAADIAGLISISACFRVTITYANGAVSGQAVFRVEFRIAIVRYGFSIRVGYRQNGDSAGQSEGPAGARSAATTESLSSEAAGGRGGALECRAPLEAVNLPGTAANNCRAPGFLDRRAWPEYWSAFEDDGACKPLEATR